MDYFNDVFTNFWALKVSYLFILLNLKYLYTGLVNIHVSN